MPEIVLSGDTIKNTENFTYLGSNISGDGGINKEITIRIGKANAAFGKLYKVFKSKSTKLKTKISIQNNGSLSSIVWKRDMANICKGQERPKRISTTLPTEYYECQLPRPCDKC